MSSLLTIAARSTIRTAQRARRFGGNAPAKQYEGIEAKIRSVLPKDEHIVLAWIGTCVGLYYTSKLFSSGDSKPAVVEQVHVAPAASSSSETDIPSIMSADFEEWSKIPGNMAKWEESVANFDAWIKVPGNKEKYDEMIR